MRLPRGLLRDSVAGLSLANLCLLGAWAEVLLVNAPRAYFLKVTGLDLVAALLNLLLLGVVITWLVRLARRTQHPSVRRVVTGVVLAALLVPINLLRREVLGLGPADLLAALSGLGRARAPILALGAGLIVWAIIRFQPRVWAGVNALLLFLAPFAALTSLRAGWVLLTDDLSETADPPLAPRIHEGARSPRVLILLFDELDERLVFTNRADGLALPEFDRLSAEAVAGTQTWPAGPDTDTSIPGLIAGRLVVRASPASPHELSLWFQDADGPVGWSTEPSLFSKARALGMDVAVAGWYHPYCRLFNASLTRCHWEPHTIVTARGARSLAAAITAQWAGMSPWSNRRNHIANYERLRHEAVTLATDSTIELVFAHLSVPHLPPIYDRGRDALTLHNYSSAGYLDNLVLADRLLGEIRRSLEGRGLWPRTHVIVTSDHAWRLAARHDGIADHRVPLLVKLAGRTSGLAYTRPLNTIVVHDLTLALLASDVHTTDQLTAWLDQQRGRFPVSPDRAGGQLPMPRSDP